MFGVTKIEARRRGGIGEAGTKRWVDYLGPLVGARKRQYNDLPATTVKSGSCLPGLVSWERQASAPAVLVPRVLILAYLAPAPRVVTTPDHVHVLVDDGGRGVAAAVAVAVPPRPRRRPRRVGSARRLAALVASAAPEGGRQGRHQALLLLLLRLQGLPPGLPPEVAADFGFLAAEHRALGSRKAEGLGRAVFVRGEGECAARET